MFEKFSSDILFSISLKLDLPDLIRLCNTSKKINLKICKRDYIWLEKLNIDYPDRQKLKENPKDLYILLWALTDFKKELNLKKDIYSLYYSNELNLIYKNLKKLPSTIRFLTNLQILNVSNNRLTELPDFLPDSIKELYVGHNQIEVLPDKLPSSLHTLYAGYNQIKELPATLPDSLETLYVGYNHLKELPIKLPISLQKFYAGYNYIIDCIKYN